MKQKKNVIIGLILFGSLLIFTNFFFYITPSTVDREFNLTTTTDDGISLSYDLYTLKNRYYPVSNHTHAAIILGHGLMVNKEMMHLLALELANQGFIVIVPDFRSHGRSGGNFNSMAQGIVDTFTGDRELGNSTGVMPSAYDRSFLKADVLAMKRVLISRDDVDIHNLGYLGFSMGAEAGFEIVPYDSDFKATVGLAPTFDYGLVNATNPRNLLLMVGRFDEAIRIDALYTAMASRTHLLENQIEIGHQYGSFENGTASKLYIDPFAEHFLGAYNPNYIREARDWFVQALLGISPPEDALLYSKLILLVALQFIGALGLFFFLAKIILSKWGVNVPALESTVPKIKFHPIFSIIPFLIFGSYPWMLLLIPIFLAPLLFTGLILLLFGGPALAIAFYRMLLSRRMKQNLSLFGEITKVSSKTNGLIGLLLGGLLFGLLYISAGNIFGIIPNISKLPWVLFYCLLLILLLMPFFWFLLPFSMANRPPKQSFMSIVIGGGFRNSIFISLILMAEVLLPSILLKNYFITMILIPIGFTVFVAGFVSSYLYSKNGDLIIPLIAIAIFMAVIFCTISPLFELYRLNYSGF